MARILIIDDDGALQRMIRTIVESAGHSAASVGNGPDGLKALRAGPFDLVICDVMMPDMDGYDVARRIRADPQTKDVLLLTLTARAQAVDYDAAMEAGADAFLAKPVSPQQLKDKIAEMFAAGRPAPETGGGRVIVSLGLRGGAGTTTLAANLGALFARARRRVC